MSSQLSSACLCLGGGVDGQWRSQPSTVVFQEASRSKNEIAQILAHGLTRLTRLDACHWVVKEINCGPSSPLPHQKMGLQGTLGTTPDLLALTMAMKVSSI